MVVFPALEDEHLRIPPRGSARIRNSSGMSKDWTSGACGELRTSAAPPHTSHHGTGTTACSVLVKAVIDHHASVGCEVIVANRHEDDLGDQLRRARIVGNDGGVSHRQGIREAEPAASSNTLFARAGPTGRRTFRHLGSKWRAIGNRFGGSLPRVGVRPRLEPGEIRENERRVRQCRVVDSTPSRPRSSRIRRDKGVFREAATRGVIQRMRLCPD